MGIRLTHRDEMFHVPYGPVLSDGSLETQFVNLKSDPTLIPVLPPCIGWPETQELLRHINAPMSPLMSLATDQHFVNDPQYPDTVTLVSFVTVCLAEIAHNQQTTIYDLATFLDDSMNTLLQEVSNSLQQALPLDIILKTQPTIFHLWDIQGWSLTVFMSVSGEEHHTVRGNWGWGIQSLIDATISYGRTP